MLVSSATLEHAFWTILSRHDAHAGTALQFREVEEDWGETGLRRGDLRDAVRLALERGWIECIPDPGGLALRLTASGYRNFYQLHEMGASLAAVQESEKVLDWARSRPRVRRDAGEFTGRAGDAELH